MRISDWSSDVCSSDLLVHRTLELVREAGGETLQAIDQPRRAFIEIVDVEDRAAVARELVRIGRAHRRRQIGDARRLGSRTIAEGRPDEAVVFRLEPGDRKSTRLNSST